MKVMCAAVFKRNEWLTMFWISAHGIKFMRISSELFPFASHDTVGYSLEYAKDELKQVGELAAKYNHRLVSNVNVAQLLVHSFC